jgi:uncharacterized membrane protein YfcA
LLGGALALRGTLYRVLVGIVLLFAVYRLLWYADQAKLSPTAVPLLPALVFGTGLGFISGRTGIRGGIFLGLLLIMMGWAESCYSAGVSAAFVLVNWVTGLSGMS